MGRPTVDPRTIRLEIRLSESENKILTECVNQTGRDKTSIMVEGILRVYESLKSKSE